LAEEFSRNGLTVHHLDQADQRALIADLPPAVQAGVTGIVGSADAEAFHHKGSSVTRNIAYLWLNKLPDDDNIPRTLSVDPGESNNSFGIVLSHLTPDGNPFVDLAIGLTPMRTANAKLRVHFQKTLDLVSARVIDVDDLITSTHSIDEARDAITQATAARGLKTRIVFAA
jgi:hypothetical protein